MTRQPPRTNQEGDPCPAWCVIDHSLKFADAHVGRPHEVGSAWVCAFRNVDGTAVGINGVQDGTSADLTLSVHDALQLAGLLGMAGDGAGLAAAIRQAASDIAGGAGGEAR